MNHRELADLIERIKTDPSVLFLGQNYLSSLNGHNLFYETVNKELCDNQMPQLMEYKNIWEYVGCEGKLGEDEFAKLRQIVGKIPTQAWLRKILSMRWGMVVTSSVDSALVNCVGQNFTLSSIGYDVTKFRREFMSKSFLRGIYLYGSIDGNNGEFPPESCDTRTMRSIKKKVKDRVGWIYNDILRDYGVLVVDGWNPETDWLTTLLDDASDMPFGSIYLFGISRQIAESDIISGLVEDGIAHVESQSFAQALMEYGFFDDNEDLLSYWNGVSLTDSEVGKTITIRSSSNKYFYLNIPLFSLDTLDSHVTVIHDDLGYGGKTDEISIKENFAHFLQQNSMPAWVLYNENLGFYFKRNVDKKLLDSIYDELKKKSSYHRSFIILEGISNSGKSASLVNLALRLRSMHKYPVIFISGTPNQAEFTENLKNFIKRYFLDRQNADGEWIENVIVIWDNNSDSSARQRYEKLASDLLECNVLVVGSLYSKKDTDNDVYIDKTGIRHIRISAELTDNERNALKAVLERVDVELLNRFEELVSKGKDTYLFNVLQQLVNYSYSPEWKKVAEELRRRFNQEVDISENDAREAIIKYKQDISLEDVKEVIYEKGVAASWQLQLEAWMKANSETFDSKDAVEADRYRTLLNLNEDITLINQVLAMAGQFSVELPVTLLLRMIHKDSNSISKEDLFINDVLENDSLIRYHRDEQGYPMVRFRHPSEAGLYVSKNFGDDPQKLKEKEVDLLCGIIRACRWDDESYEVLALVRKFGSNSDGKYNENISKGQYWNYADWWATIAECLKQNSDGNPEAVLVYAHLMREKYSYDKKHYLNGSEPYLRAAARELRQALEDHDRGNKAQYCRLIVEVCSNLVASMPRDRESGIFDRDVFLEFHKHFIDAIRNWTTNDSGSYFSTNALLDIWLNAIHNFKCSFLSLEKALDNKEFVQALSNTINYIDILFEMSDDFDSLGLLSKIDEVYKWSGNLSMEKIGRKLSSNGNDTYLYLTARHCWLTNNPKPRPDSRLEEIIRYNLYFLMDDADRREELLSCLTELKELAKISAMKAIDILTPNMALIHESKSSRCLYMLIRAKWLIYTGNMLLEEKQTPILTRSQWSELNELCGYYIIYCAKNNVPVKPSVNIIKGIYLWTYTNNIAEAKQVFSSARLNMGNEWFFERIGLCIEGTNRLRQFNIDIKRNSHGKYEATIKRELAVNGKVGDSNIIGRYGIYVSDWVLSNLFDGQQPRERYDIPKPVVIWFNSQGALLGLAGSEKEGGRK